MTVEELMDELHRRPPNERVCVYIAVEGDAQDEMSYRDLRGLNEIDSVCVVHGKAMGNIISLVVKL